jgi:hypothetical protein
VVRAGFATYHAEVQLGDQDSPVVNTEPSTLLTSGVQSDGSVVQYAYPVPPSLTRSDAAFPGAPSSALVCGTVDSLGPAGASQPDCPHRHLSRGAWSSPVPPRLHQSDRPNH